VFPPTPRLRRARRSATRGGGRFGSGFESPMPQPSVSCLMPYCSSFL
jgi:hypothetical protein